MVGSGSEVNYGFVTMAGEVRGSLGSESAAGTGLVADVRRGGEGLRRSSEADGLSVVKTGVVLI